MTDLHKPKISGRGKLAASTSLRGFASIDEAKDAPHEYLCPITLQLMRLGKFMTENLSSPGLRVDTTRAQLVVRSMVPMLLDSLACPLESLPSRGRMS